VKIAKKIKALLLTFEEFYSNVFKVDEIKKFSKSIGFENPFWIIDIK